MLWNPAYQTQNICFTANIPDGMSFTAFPMDGLRIRLNPVWMVAQAEKAPGTGKLHWQGFIHLGKKMSNQKIMRFFAEWGIKAHLEAKSSKSTYEQQREYCHKDESCADPASRFAFGEQPPEQGNRTDLAGMVQRIKEGATDRDLLEENAQQFMIHHKAFAMVRKILAPLRTEPSQLIFIWGPTGNGKTTAAMSACDPAPEIVEWEGGRFLMGYTGSKPAVCFDDFEWPGMTIHRALRLCDRWPLELGIKGSSVVFAPTTIIFTSNDNPRDWWPDASEAHKAAWNRRIEEFGTVHYLESKLEVKVAQNLLTKYFVKKAAPLPAPILEEPISGKGGSMISIAEDSSEEENSEPSEHEIQEQRKRKAKEPKGKEKAGTGSLKKTKTTGGPMDGFLRSRAGFAPGCNGKDGCTTNVCFC